MQVLITLALAVVLGVAPLGGPSEPVASNGSAVGSPVVSATPLDEVEEAVDAVERIGKTGHDLCC